MSLNSFAPKSANVPADFANWEDYGQSDATDSYKGKTASQQAESTKRQKSSLASRINQEGQERNENTPSSLPISSPPNRTHYTFPGQLQLLHSDTDPRSIQQLHTQSASLISSPGKDSFSASPTSNQRSRQSVDGNYSYDFELERYSSQAHSSASHSGIKATRTRESSPAGSSSSSTLSRFTGYPKHLFVLPVLLLEFLALALTRAILPGLLLEQYGSQTYLVLGCADCVKGLLAFVANPVFGKVSDQLGRKPCLWITVLGTCAPVCSLALFAWQNAALSIPTGVEENGAMDSPISFWERLSLLTKPPSHDNGPIHATLPPMAIPLFVILLSISGIFASTFTLVFAYISDTVEKQEDRVNAYGLALATFGLSFTIGPIAGGYLAQTQPHLVFVASLILTILNLMYIYWLLPESKQINNDMVFINQVDDFDEKQSTTSSIFLMKRKLDISWSSPIDSIQLIREDPFLNAVGKVALLYYTGLWAVISTLSLYAVQHFGLGPQALGELMSALGLSTMLAEAVLVRVLVPLLGEKEAIKLGLASFSLQCFILGLAYEKWHLFVCVACSILGNLVYPSLSSLVSGTVEPRAVGEALGAINGIKALTEGIGPLLFGALMTISEEASSTPGSSDNYLGYLPPGWPYWIAGILVCFAYRFAERLLPDDTNPSKKGNVDAEYIHELEFKWRRSGGRPHRSTHGQQIETKQVDDIDIFFGCLDKATPTRDHVEEEYADLLPRTTEKSAHLSEVEEEDELFSTPNSHLDRDPRPSVHPTSLFPDFATPRS